MDDEIFHTTLRRKLLIKKNPTWGTCRYCERFRESLEFGAKFTIDQSNSIGLQCEKIFSWDTFEQTDNDNRCSDSTLSSHTRTHARKKNSLIRHEIYGFHFIWYNCCSICDTDWLRPVRCNREAANKTVIAISECCLLVSLPASANRLSSAVYLHHRIIHWHCCHWTERVLFIILAAAEMPRIQRLLMVFITIELISNYCLSAPQTAWYKTYEINCHFRSRCIASETMCAEVERERER